MCAQISWLKSRMFTIITMRIGATSANSIIVLPSSLPASHRRQGRVSPARLREAQDVKSLARSPDKCDRADVVGRQRDTSRCAASMRQDAARTVYRDVVDNEFKARLSIARLIDGTFERDTGMGEIDDTRDLPGGGVPSIRDVDPGCQGGILIDRDALPGARCRCLKV